MTATDLDRLRPPRNDALDARLQRLGYTVRRSVSRQATGTAPPPRAKRGDVIIRPGGYVTHVSAAPTGE